MDTDGGTTGNRQSDVHRAALVDEGTMRAWITSMGRRASIGRGPSYVQLYLRARDISISGETSLSLPLSRILLADALGVTSVHINRC